MWDNRRRATSKECAAGREAAVGGGHGAGRIERMARRDDGDLGLLVEQLARAPWWVSVVLAVVVYIGLSNVLPFVVGSSPAFGPIVDVVSGLAWLFAGIFLLSAALSALRVWRGRRMLAANRTKEEIRALGWEEFEELIEAHYRRLGFGVRREGDANPPGSRGA